MPISVFGWLEGMQNETEPLNVLERLLDATDADLPAPSSLIVAAHPDDEVIGAGGCMPRFKEAFYVHVTDGAPRNMQDALSLGLKTREDYARVRRQEFMSVLALLGVGRERHLEMGYVDQEASLTLEDLTHRLSDIIDTYRPELILCHSYEGGHPDHDAACFAVHAARQLLSRKCNNLLPLIAEFTSYHASVDGMATSEFLSCGEEEVGITVRLSEGERNLKRRMLNCFKTQQRVLSGFPISDEKFRIAPRYVFGKPPHEGRLFYENFPWGMTGEHWRNLAVQAVRNLGLPSTL